MTSSGEPPVVILADELYDGTGAEPVERPALTLAAGRIAAVEVRTESWRPPTGVTLLDRRGCTLLPGLIDSHVHLAMTPEPAWPPHRLPADRAEDGWLMAGMQRAQAALAAGITTIRDCGSASLVNIALRESRDAGLWTGPRIVACGLPLTTTAGHLHRIGLRCDSGDELRRGVRWNAERHADFIKVALTGGMSTPGSVPSRLQYSCQELRVAVEDAHRLGLRVAAHVLSSAGVRTAVAAEVDTVEHCWTVTGAPQDFDPAAVEEMARSRSMGSVTAHRHLRELLPKDGSDGDIATLRRRLEPHRALCAAGVPMVVHSDSDGVKNRFGEFARSLEVFKIGMDVATPAAVAAATGLAAEAVGMREIGSLRSGQLADVLVVDGRLSSDIRSLGHVRDVFLGGEPVVLSGRLCAGVAEV